MSPRNDPDWELTDEALPDLFELVDNPSTPSRHGATSQDDTFANDLAENIASMLTDEFPAIQRPGTAAAPRASRSRAEDPSEALRPLPPRRAPTRQGPPPLPVAPPRRQQKPVADADTTAGKGGDAIPMADLADAQREGFRICPAEDELFLLEDAPKTQVMELPIWNEET